MRQTPSSLGEAYKAARSAAARVPSGTAPRRDEPTARSMMRATLREDLDLAVPGRVRAGRLGVVWRPCWSLRTRSVPWERDGLLEVMLRGPWGALALAELQRTIRACAALDGPGADSPGVAGEA